MRGSSTTSGTSLTTPDLQAKWNVDTHCEIGLKGAYTIVRELVEGEPAERKRRFLEGEPEDKVKALAQAPDPFLKA